MLTLVVNKGPDLGRVYTLPAKKLHLLGRFNRVLSVFVSDQAVSRIHAELIYQKNCWYIRDMQSTNGTYVNGMQVDGKIPLKHRDQIQIGGTVFAVDLQVDKTAPSHHRDAGKLSPVSGEKTTLLKQTQTTLRMVGLALVQIFSVFALRS